MLCFILLVSIIYSNQYTWASDNVRSDVQLTIKSHILADTKQLVRHKHIISICKQTQQLDVDKTNLSKRIYKPPSPIEDHFDRKINQLDQSILATYSDQLKCANGEMISLVSLDDLTISMRHNNETSAIISAKEYCQLKRQINEYKTSNQTHDEALLAESPSDFDCDKILLAQHVFFEQLKRNCDEATECFIPRDPSVQLSLRSCEKTSGNAKLQLNYICLPLKSRFNNRTINYMDVTNSISCPMGRILYIKQVSLNIVKDRPQIKRFKFRPQVQNLDYSITSIDQPDEEDEDYLPVDSHRQIANSQQVASNQIHSQCSIPIGIMKNCHANTSCPNSLSKLLNNSPPDDCAFVKKDRDSSQVRIRYICLSDSKFSPTSSLSVKETVDKGETSGLMVANVQDYNRQDLPDLGEASLSIDRRIPDNGGQDSKLAMIGGTQIVIITILISIVIQFKL